MTDINHYWGGDLSLSATGDLLTVDGVTETNQRILRGLMTAAPEYVFHPDYGAAIGQHVGAALTAAEYARIQANVRSIVINDPNVQTTPAPTFSFQASPTGYLVATVGYVYKPTGQLQSLTFQVSK